MSEEENLSNKLTFAPNEKRICNRFDEEDGQQEENPLICTECIKTLKVLRMTKLEAPIFFCNELKTLKM